MTGIYLTAVADALDSVLDEYREQVLTVQDSFEAGTDTALSSLVYQFDHVRAISEQSLNEHTARLVLLLYFGPHNLFNVLIPLCRRLSPCLC